MEPKLVPIKNGWAAVADYWAVFGATKEEAIEKFRAGEKLRKEIASRPDPILNHPTGA